MQTYNHPIFYVEAFEIVGPYILHIKFDDGSEQIVNLEPVLRGGLLGPLYDLTTFNQVRLDPEIRNLVWPNDAAFDPETLRNWPQYKDAFIEMAQSWEAVAAD